ncbi:hypothetical protein V6Z11_A05G379700 [Gossypium hirsutum]
MLALFRSQNRNLVSLPYHEYSGQNYRYFLKCNDIFLCFDFR